MKRFNLLCLISLLMASPFSWSSVQPLELNAVPSEQLAQYIADFKQQKQQLWIRVHGEKFPLNIHTISSELLIAHYAKGLVTIPFSFEDPEPGTNVTIYEGRFDQAESFESKIDFKQAILKSTTIWKSSNVSTTEQENIVYHGKLVNQKGTETDFEMSINEALITGGTSLFSIEQNRAILTGELGTNTYVQLSNLVERNPNVDTIVIKAVNGSLNDEINMHTGNLLRDSGLNTKIPNNGYAYSGGVDLFAAGVNRQVEGNGVLGVHSWCCSAGTTADKLPKDDDAHHDQVVYFTKMLGKEVGPDFYFYTIHAAPFSSVHPMTRTEMADYSLLTK
ncbi:hypothetical protein QWZ04_16230 [Vibrio tapetis subsp. quintayensis]|uniref:hypothetical protein n=1 Tax=Vibrio tapetis TaxID=52443 RepID=UPI0025B317B3|nr:hypothetical protein [Vibrio tapetis]MDN3681854.1 hypothetical protein [Vibrio tapetis subsp. quintayensis]